MSGCFISQNSDIKLLDVTYSNRCLVSEIFMIFMSILKQFASEKERACYYIYLSIFISICISI